METLRLDWSTVRPSFGNQLTFIAPLRTSIHLRDYRRFVQQSSPAGCSDLAARDVRHVA